jgi:hypothetical protein
MSSPSEGPSARLPGAVVGRVRARAIEWRGLVQLLREPDRQLATAKGDEKRQLSPRPETS